MQIKRMKILSSYNPKPKKNLGGTSSKNLLGNRLVRSAYKFEKLVIETSSKVRKPKTYNKAINNHIYENRWHKVIDKELWNLNTYQTWCYTSLSDNQKGISYKWVFKMKYNSNGFIGRYKVRLDSTKIFLNTWNQLHGDFCINNLTHITKNIPGHCHTTKNDTYIDKYHWRIPEKYIWAKQAANLYKNWSKMSS